MEKNMRNPFYTATLVRTIRMAIIIVLLAPGLEAKPAVHPDADPADGIDDAQKSTVLMSRDPFWPVGYRPKWKVQTTITEQSVEVESEAEAGTDWNRAMERIAIQGISSKADNEFFAVINGQVKGTGETLSVQVGNVIYTWMIKSISPPNSVKLRRVSAR